MSSILDKLLKGQSFEWKTLGEVSEFKYGKGNTIPTNGGKYPVYGCNGIVGTHDQFNNENSPIIGHIGTAGIVVWGEGKHFVTYNGTICNPKKDILLSKYVYHYLLTLRLTELTKGSQPFLSYDTLKKICIPIPPLDVQAKIVKILDALTALTAELTAELTMREKQYHYYRDNLLTFSDDEVEWKTLDQFSTNFDSKRKPITSGLRESGEIPYYGASGIVDYVKDYIFDGDYLLISEDGANLLARSTPIAFSISGKTWVNNHAHVLKFETYEERKFVEYYLNSIDLTPYISGAAQPKLNKQNLNSIKFPYPKLNEQKRIVAILDKFETITNSITEGLPKEIALRQKQYEYYREQLLDFPK